MSPFFRKDRLKQQPELRIPVSAQALVVRGDPGYSAMSWWSASIKLQVAVPGQEPVLVEHDGNVIREKTPVAGSVLPVDVERDDPTQVRIRWDEVPTIEQRIADRDPLIFDPEAAWRFVLEADPRQAEAKPAWGNGALPGWPSSDALGHGRKPGTALVIAHSWDPGGNVSGGFAPPHAGRYSFGGTIETGLHTYLGWLLLCVNSYDGERYGLAVETKIRRDRFGPVLPLAIHPDQPGDIDIVWKSAPEAPPPPSTGTQVANTIVHGGQVIQPGSAAAADILSQAGNPNVGALGNRLLKRMSAKGAMIVVSSPGETDAPVDRSAALAQLQGLRDRGVLSADEYDAAVAKLPPA